MNAIDLFAGCGGLSKGFMDAGFSIIVGVDNDQAALNTFARNHDGAVALNADLSQQETFDRIKEIAGDRPIDVIIAGPPCQGFSLTGPRNFDDKRNKLYLAVFEVVKQFNPKGFIIENVPGMATLYEGQIKDEILKRFRALGYNVECKILCAADYGVPQLRKRLVFMGVRKDIGKPCFPAPSFTPETYRTCRDAISDLPSRIDGLGSETDIYTCEPKTEYQRLMRGSCKVLSNHVATAHKQFVIDTIALVPEGGNYKDLPPGWGESRKFHMAWTRLNGNTPSRTVDTGHRNIFHYELNRIPTVREDARIQSFPDDFVFTGTKTQQSRQVGNAVPPLLGYALGKALAEIIEGSEGEKNATKMKSIDLFAGCGGLMDGFEQTGLFDTLAAVEWEKMPCLNLEKRLSDKWGYADAKNRVLRFDIQRTEELFEGWNDPEYGSSDGLDSLVLPAGGIDVIIGGPPCQAYSIAGRVRDENGMRNDYRNYLFESYLKVVSHYKPKAFVFENVPGILSAKPGDRPIIEIIQESFLKCGYYVLPNLKDAIIDFTEYGVPQNRSRIIIFGLRIDAFGEDVCKEAVDRFYKSVLPKHKTKRKMTVREAIGDLPKLRPLEKDQKYEGKRISHSLPEPFVQNHIARWQSKRDMDIFRLLIDDIDSGRNEYVSTEALKRLYTERTGKTSNVHKYHVIRWDEPSNLIPAHLFKDGLRHIHPDIQQLRTITVREAARLQTFDDDYVFYGSNVDTYKMIGNAVPPKFSKCLALAVYEMLSDLMNIGGDR